MSDDWYLDSIDQVQRAADDLHASLDVAMDTLAHARTDRVAGDRLVDIIRGLIARGGRETRLAPTQAFHAFEQAITAYRARAIRALVDEEHMTYTEIAELIGVSRQMVARLYRATSLTHRNPGDHSQRRP
jgi:DNA-directed RNA polymerase specialized sigma24 family protein